MTAGLLRSLLLISCAVGVGFFAIVADELNLWLYPLHHVESAAQDRTPPTHLPPRDESSSRASSDLTKGFEEVAMAGPHLGAGHELASQGLRGEKTDREAQSMARSAADVAPHSSEMNVLQMQESSGASRSFVEGVADPVATVDREPAGRINGPDLFLEIGEVFGRARTRVGQLADWYSAVRDVAELQVRGYLTQSFGRTSADTAGGPLPLRVAEENRSIADSQVGAVDPVKDAKEFAKQDTDESSDQVRSVTLGQPAIEASHADKAAADGALNGSSDELSKGETKDARDRSRDGLLRADHGVAENHEAGASSDGAAARVEEKALGAQRTLSARELKMQRRAERRMRREARKQERDRLAGVTHATTRQATKQARPLERQVGAVDPVKDATEFAKQDTDESSKHVRGVTVDQPAMEASHGDKAAADASVEEKALGAQRTLSARELKMQRQAERRMRREARKHELAMARATHATIRQATKQGGARPPERRQDTRRPTLEELLDERE